MRRTNDDAPLIAYVCSSGRSGSTLLDLMLNSHPEMCALGEVHRIAKYLNENKLCTCGENLNDCQFWQNVFAEYRRSIDESYITDGTFMLTDSGIHMFDRILERLFLIVLSPEAFSRTAQRKFMHNVKSTRASINLATLVKKISKASIVVDTTKDARRMKYLVAMHNTNVKVIRLYRDGRAVALSAVNREDTNMLKASASWAFTQLKIWMSLLTVPKTNIFHMKYEDFCTDPRSSLISICEFLEISPNFPEFGLIDKCNSHSVAGNPMRFRRSEVEIKANQSWEREITKTQSIVFALIAGLVNRLCGYR